MESRIHHWQPSRGQVQSEPSTSSYHIRQHNIWNNLWRHCIQRFQNYWPIVHANLLPLTAKRLLASSSRSFYITMILECEVSKLIKHESKKWKLSTPWHMGTRSRRRCTTWIQYYLWIFRDCYQRRGNRQAHLQDTICGASLSWCRKAQSCSRFNQCSPKFCTTTDRTRCYYGIWRLDLRYFSIVSPIIIYATSINLS